MEIYKLVFFTCVQNAKEQLYDMVSIFFFQFGALKKCERGAVHTTEQDIRGT